MKMAALNAGYGGGEGGREQKKEDREGGSKRRRIGREDRKGAKESVRKARGDQHRYWTRLMLCLCCVLYLVFVLLSPVSADPSHNLLAVEVVVILDVSH